jgi:hypothetical protein
MSSGPPSGGRRVRRNVVDAVEVVAGIDIQLEVAQGSDIGSYEAIQKYCV